MNECVEAGLLVRRGGEPCLDDLFRHGRMLDPVRDGRHPIELVLAQDRFHGPAIGMAANHDILDAERRYGIFDAGRNASCRWTVGWNNVSGIAHHENLARLALGKNLRRDAGVGARDEHRKWCLMRSRTPAGHKTVHAVYFGLEAQRALD